MQSISTMCCHPKSNPVTYRQASLRKGMVLSINYFPYSSLQCAHGSSATISLARVWPTRLVARGFSILVLLHYYRYFTATKDVIGTLKLMPENMTRERLVLKALKCHGYSDYGCTRALCSLPYNSR